MASVACIRSVHRRMVEVFGADGARLAASTSTWAQVLGAVDDDELQRRLDAYVGRRRAPTLSELAGTGARPARGAAAKRGRTGDVDTRIEEARASVERFEELVDDARDAGNFGAAVQAAARRDAAAAALYALEQAAAASRTRDPVLRLERLRGAATAAGSFVAAAKLGDQIEQAKATRRASRRRRRGVASSHLEFLERRVEELLETSEASTGGARVAALRAVVEVRAHLEVARAAVAATDPDLDDETLAAKLEEEAVDMPDEHLAIFVRAYCERHGLDMPRRIHAGGAS